MGAPRVIRYGADFTTHLPVSGSGAAMVAGTLMKKGLTSYLGSLVQAGGTSAVHYCIGILKEAHATALDTTLAGTVFTTRPIELVIPFRVVRVEYDQTGIVCTQAVSTTTLTLTDLENDIDAAFLYVSTGLGAGQTNYLTASASGSCTLKAAFGTSLDTTSYVVKILPRFHTLMSFNSSATVPTKLATQALVGAVQGFILDTWIERDGRLDQLNPVKHAALTDLAATGRVTKFYADLCVTDTGPYPTA